MASNNLSRTTTIIPKAPVNSGIPNNPINRAIYPTGNTNPTKFKAHKVKKESHTMEIVLIAILVIIILVLVTTTVFYLRRRGECYTYASPWCYDDWICENLPEDEQNRWEALRKLGLSSSPSSALAVTAGRCFLSDGPTNPECVQLWNFVGPNAGNNCRAFGVTQPCNVPYTPSAT